MAVALRAYDPPPSRKRRHGVKRALQVRARAAGHGLRLAALLATPLAMVFAYVWLTAELTAQTYRLHDDLALYAQLTARSNDLRQQEARLESLPRLEAAAAKLHMVVPSGVALIAPSGQAAPQAPTTAFAASLADLRHWLSVR